MLTPKPQLQENARNRALRATTARSNIIRTCCRVQCSTNLCSRDKCHTAVGPATLLPNKTKRKRFILTKNFDCTRSKTSTCVHTRHCFRPRSHSCMDASRFFLSHKGPHASPSLSPYLAKHADHTTVAMPYASWTVIFLFFHDLAPVRRLHCHRRNKTPKIARRRWHPLSRGWTMDMTSCKHISKNRSHDQFWFADLYSKRWLLLKFVTWHT